GGATPPAGWAPVGPPAAPAGGAAGPPRTGPGNQGSSGGWAVPPDPSAPPPGARGRPVRKNEDGPAVGRSYDIPDRAELAGEVPRAGGASAAVSADGLVAGERHPIDRQCPEIEDGTAKAARTASAPAARCSAAGTVATTRQAVV